VLLFDQLQTKIEAGINHLVDPKPGYVKWVWGDMLNYCCWVDSDGFSVGFVECFHGGVLEDSLQVPCMGKRFLDPDVDEKWNPPRAIPCKNQPACMDVANRGKYIVEKTEDGRFVAVSKFIAPRKDEKLREEQGRWCRLIFMPIRSECLGLTDTQRDAASSDDLRNLLSTLPKP